MSHKSIISQLPSIYVGLLPELFSQLEAPDEKYATCANCAMVCEGKQDRQVRYSPDIKCCTYYPSVPNFLVGAILSEPNDMDEGKKRIMNQIRKRRASSPVGVYAPRIYHAMYQRGHGQGFGRSARLVCPYFDSNGGLCTIWRHREAVCSTFFCKTSAAKPGRIFWDGVKSYLRMAQRVLTLHALKELKIANYGRLVEDFMSEQYEFGPLSTEDLDEQIGEEQWNMIWGDWVGREAEFYIACYQTIKKLNITDFSRLAGIESDYLLTNVVVKLNNVTNFPSFLKINLSNYNKTDDGLRYKIRLPVTDVIVELPVDIGDKFDGKNSTEEILSAASLNHLNMFDEELVTSLWHNGILQAP